MQGAPQHRIDSQQIDSRQRRDLAADRAADRRAASSVVDPAQAPLERGGGSREPVLRALEASDERPRTGVESRVRSEELRALPPASYKVVENRLRRMADRQNLQLVKSRRRDRNSPDHGKYMLVDRLSTAVPAGGNWTLELGEVE